MAAKITRDVVESRLRCKYKAHLKLAGEQGNKCDYERLLVESRAEVRLKAVAKVLARHTQEEVAQEVPLTAEALRQGSAFVLDATLEDDALSLRFDGLKKVEGASRLGEFHYVPVLFHEGRKLGMDQRYLLEMYGLLLARVQGRMPSHGIILNGRECKITKVKLNPDMRHAEHLLRDLKEMASGEAASRLLLNDHCQMCEFRQRCHEQAVKEDNLSLLRGMGEKEVKGYARKGILTLTQLAHTFRPRRKGKRQVKKTHHRYHALQALAIRDKKVYVFGTPELPDSPVRIYLDLEGDPGEGYVYLIGMIVVRDGTETRASFWANSKEQEADIFDEFLAEVSRYEAFSVYCYGGYERSCLIRMRKTAKRKDQVDRVLGALVNILSLVYAHFYFPTYSNGLKDVAACLGCGWTEPEASGIQSVVWRRTWEATGEGIWKQKLVTYNLEDCAALKRVTELVFAATAKMTPAGGQVPTGLDGPPVFRVQEIDKLTHDRKWGRVNFVHPDYKFINDCAYFDYQRERVYVRTSKTLKKNVRRQANARKLKPRATKQLVITVSTCPRCGGAVTTDAMRKPTRCQPPTLKRAFDLVMIRGSLRRLVIECRSSLYLCLHCGLDFVPDEYERLDKHFHGLKSWAMYLHVAHRLSFRTVPVLFEEFFGLRVHESEVHMFKSLMARYYQDTYQGLLRKILSGNLLHIDETEVNLQSGKGYVWIFANLEEVVYIYRPTREGDFLKEMLKDFHGVVVSDFYAAYDSLACLQQKCLIHLMRDMNQELLNSPYDEELQSITRPFGALLRAIVGTVDEYGLKRRHLQRHRRDVDEFFESLAERDFRSEPAEALRKRLTKYQAKLFTFIDHDGVPWNNNNAENAIKRFAYYREETVRMLKERGLSDYLVLLSLYQTCRYKGVSFFKFLRSQEKDIDLFCARRREKRKSFSVEQYPKGFIPPLNASWWKGKSSADKVPQRPESDAPAAEAPDEPLDGSKEA